MRKKYIDNKEKFYLKLFLYKSFLFKNTEFYSDIDDEELQNIITALNIKKRNKRIEFVYDSACKQIDKFYEGKNICGFADSRCALQRSIETCNFKNGCCRACMYVTSKGCSTSNLSCKFFYCGYVRDKYPILKFKDVKICRLFSLRQQLIARDSFFTSREDLILDLKVGFLIFYATRLVFRLIRNLIYFVRHESKINQL